MEIPEGALPLDWWDRMDRVLLRKRRHLKDDENLCSACGYPVWTPESTRPVLIQWTDDNPPSPYGIGDLQVYQFCEHCRTD